MGLLNRKQKEIPNVHAEKMRQAAETAVEYASDFRAVFDYSNESIESLEGILDYYSNDLRQAQPTENQIWSMALFFGAYLGETMLRNGLADKGYEWSVEDGSSYPVLSLASGYTAAPIDKVYKRFVNGAEDNVVSFYSYGMEEFCGIDVGERLSGTYSNITLLGGGSIDEDDPPAWLFSNGCNGIVVEQQDASNVCIYATNANHQEIFCATPLGFGESLQGVPCAIYLRDSAPSKIQISGDAATVFIDFENGKCSNNLGAPISGSLAWGTDVAVPWDESMVL